jgi:predicted  nucleic acid-binding Zn-ribbon protein
MEQTDLTQENFDALKRRLTAANTEITDLNMKLKTSEHIIGVMEERNKQLITGKLTTDQVIQQEIQRINEQSNKYLEENEQLKTRISELVNSD